MFSDMGLGAVIYSLYVYSLYVYNLYVYRLNVYIIGYSFSLLPATIRICTNRTFNTFELKWYFNVNEWKRCSRIRSLHESLSCKLE